LGPTWVWPDYQPVAAEWLVRLGLETLPQFDEGDAVIDDGPELPATRQMIPGQQGIRKIADGAAAIIERLVSRLPADMIVTNSPVTQITNRDDSIEISVSGPAGETSIRSRFAVIATPLRVAATSIAWSPEQDRSFIRAMIDTPTWMAVHAKAIALYDQPFWRQQGLSGRIASRAGPLVEAHDHSGENGSPAAIFGFVGWPPDIREDLGDKPAGEITAQLARCLGPQAGRPIAVHIEDWALNDHICTPLDARGPMNHPEIAPDIIRQPHLGRRVVFAAAETSVRSPGLIEGAFAAGMSAAGMILKIRAD
ncbi:MAG: flavin monoamine oxidase family protein, partial [Aestuariivirgaceae bacterium]